MSPVTKSPGAPGFGPWVGLIAWSIVLLSASFVGCADDLIGPNGEAWNIDDELKFAAIDAPEEISFGRVQLGEAAESTAVVQNVGHAPLEIRAVQTTEGVHLLPPALEQDQPVVLEPGQHVELTFRLDATAVDTSQGELFVESNDPRRPSLRIGWRANVLDPCADIYPRGEIDMGEAMVGQSMTRTIRVTNCDIASTLKVGSIEVDGDPAFSLAGHIDDGQVLEAGPGATLDLQISFTPSAEGEHEATISFETNDPQHPNVGIDVIGVGAIDDCITPVIEASAPSQSPLSSQQKSTLNASVLDTISLDASASFDPAGGAIEEFSWTLVDAPQDSGAILEDFGDPRKRELTLDLAGTYVVELDAANDHEEWACHPARLTIMALVGSDIHVQLVWDTPGDPYRHNDHGADMDLHFLHPDGQWDQAPYDCHWQNPQPQWSGGNDGFGDPTLDIDATQGWGPENVNLDDPDPSLQYSVGVNYFTDRGYGHSFATVRVFLEGHLTAERTSGSMETGQFWYALRVGGDLEVIDVVDQISDTFPH